MSDIRVEAAEPRHQRALTELFERCDVACHCRYWHFAGDSNEWLARSVHQPELNRTEMQRALAAQTDEMRGLVALSADEAVGWMKLSPAVSVRKLYDQRLYRGLPCFAGERHGVYAIGCLLVDPAWRRRGVARALIGAAAETARRWGARAIEAFPRRATDVSEAELWMGPLCVFREAGFEVVHDFAPYPVLRLSLN